MRAYSVERGGRTNMRIFCHPKRGVPLRDTVTKCRKVYCRDFAHSGMGHG